jgi:pimeloyl-ACP methyl ester carboxylesterase
MLQLPGNTWEVDLPGDGSNTTENDTEYFSYWSQALVEAANALPNVILVAHSSGGMFALATPPLEHILLGLVLMDSAPNASWQQSFTQYVHANPLPVAQKLQILYEQNPSDALLKELTMACAPYFSTKRSLQKMLSLLATLPFNYRTQLWAAQNFDQTYQAKWIPRTLPTLIFSGDQDSITPLKLFTEINDFQRENILIREIMNASHFPWLDNPEDVKKTFSDYQTLLP